MQIYRGKSLRFFIIWGGSNPIDISGHEAALQARSLDGNLMLDLSTANGGISIDGPNGRLEFQASPDVTRAVGATGHYEIEMTTPSGEVYRVMSGTISPVEEVVI